MLPSNEVVELSRIQFGLTAMYHFIFVPLTLGLSVLLGIMETVYFMTGREIWRRMTKFWGVLFGINFVMGVATGITMEFQFGTNWAYYSQYVGDIFGAPLAIEGLMAFFLEATFVGMFFFGWDKLSKGAHLTVTWMVALGSNLSALWILIANGWMQHPVGTYFNYQTMRMEVNDFAAVLLNPVAQAKFVHTISAGYVTGAVFILSVSAYYLLRKRNIDIAKRSIMVASAFGLAVSLSAVVLGDESGYLDSANQKMKIAGLEAMYNTEPAPASLTLVGIPDEKDQTTKYAIKIPYLLGLIATRSTDTPLPGINQIVEAAKPRIRNGMKAYGALTELQKNPSDLQAKATLKQYSGDLGYGLLLKKYTDDISQATPEQVNKAANDLRPNVPTLFWSFRIMVFCGFFFILLFLAAFYLSIKRKVEMPLFLRIAVVSLPLPWLACEAGWFVAEHGRQPWVIEGVLPTFLGTSSLSSNNLFISLGGFGLFYTILAIVELYLMVKYIRMGPDGLVTKYQKNPHNELLATTLGDK